MPVAPHPAQRLAIEAPLGPVLVVAGPGAGKTFCLIGRVDYLVRVHGLPPRRICAVTFTNKAAEEIAKRLRNTLGEAADEMTRGTLHALCLAILREHGQAAGLKPGFGIADEEYQRTVLARLNVHVSQRGTLLAAFSLRRQHHPLPPGDEQVFRDYAAHLERRNLLDFDDLIGRTAALLFARPEIAAQVAGRWDYILVDEFQDLNASQYQILRALAEPHRNFFAVGDEEQSIFSWTGADPRILATFRADYGLERPIILDRNCRSARQIFSVARRVLAQNPTLFDKQLVAERESAYEVQALAFPDEAAEAAWLIADLETDRAASGLAWGDYAVLYKRHRVGSELEGRLLRAGIPCRLARGRSLAEDHVVGHVLAALRVIQDPSDPAAVETLARVVFPAALLQEVQTAARAGGDFLEAVRRLARGRAPGDPDTKRLWRFLYQVENLAGLARTHDSLPALVGELLSQGIGPYHNALEERHDELTDPASLPDAARLADRLRHAIAAERRIRVAPLGGVEIALRGMLIGAGVRRVPSAGGPIVPEPHDVVLTPADGGDAGLAFTLFKALQLVHSDDLGAARSHYVTFDLETTDRDPATCEIVELGAVRVRGGLVVERFHTLVRPEGAISPGATKVHGYADADVRAAPPFADVWPRFHAFVGDDLLVAHNGYEFDVPVLRRAAQGMPGIERLVFFDTLPLARSLAPGGAALADLATRFGVPRGRAHHALDDAATLAAVFAELERQRVTRARKAVLVNLLDYLGLAFALAGAPPATEEGQLLLGLGRMYAHGRYSDCLEFYGAERDRDAGTGAPTVDAVVARLGGKPLMERLRRDADPAERYPAALARLELLLDQPSCGTLGGDIARLLERAALSTSDVAVDPDRVNLLTLHSTKGLEFSRVYIVGVEDFELPGYHATVERREGEIQEARRLLYVGMTRARDRLLLTRVERRFGQDTGGSAFLEAAGLVPAAPPDRG